MPIEYGQGLAEAHRARAAELYYAAFRQKMGPFLGDRGERLLADTFHADHALTAVADGNLVGLAGVEFDGAGLVGIEWEDLRATYGLLSGAVRSLGLAMFDRTAADGELLMDGIVVAAEARGQGVGSELLRRVAEFARERGLQQVRLDVVDTNPGARRLYERHGFEPTATERLPLVGRWFGFTASTTMIKRLD